jgi:hypothetical protein
MLFKGLTYNFKILCGDVEIFYGVNSISCGEFLGSSQGPLFKYTGH